MFPQNIFPAVFCVVSLLVGEKALKVNLEHILNSSELAEEGLKSPELAEGWLKSPELAEKDKIGTTLTRDTTSVES